MAITITGISGPVDVDTTHRLSARGAAAPDWDVSGNTDVGTTLVPNGARGAVLTIGPNERGPVVVTAQEIVPAAGRIPRSVKEGEQVVTVKAVAGTPTPANPREAAQQARKFLAGKTQWIWVVGGMILAGIVGMLFGQNWSAGTLHDVAGSEAAFKTLSSQAYKVLNDSRVFDEWNGVLIALILFVSVVLTLRSASKPGKTPRGCMADMATVLVATAGVFSAKNALLALFHGLPFTSVMPPLVVGILLVFVAIWLAKKFLKK
jgi:hypothetical protein